MNAAFYLLALICFLTLNSCGRSTSQVKNAQKTTGVRIGGPCEGCEAIYASPVSFDKLGWIDTLPDFFEKGPKLVISGIIYQKDLKTPARNIIYYVYHTDQSGHYTNKNNEKGWSGRNGYIKGWMRTNDKGQYKFYTLRPASYPGSVIPAHIHPLVLEPGRDPYYIDEYLFEGDPFLTPDERKKKEGRGGNGIITLSKKGVMLYGQRDIYLGKNIPAY